MDITPQVPENRKLIDSYGPGRFQISGEIFLGSRIVFPESVLDWPVASLNDLRIDSFDAVLTSDPELDILLLGTGERMDRPDLKLLADLRERGLKIDLMDTGAACRTFNVLMVEGRRAAAALIAV